MAINLNEVPDLEGLPVGEHTVKIIDYKAVTNETSGNNGYEFYVEDRKKLKHRVTIWTTQKNGTENNFKTLKRFAKACGLTEHQQGAWEPHMMPGKYFIAHVEIDKRNPKYTVIERFDPAILATAQASAKMTELPHKPAPAPVAASVIAERQPGEDDLPF